MTDRPILFSGPMVRAILDGRKTQTRRVVDVSRLRGGNFDHRSIGAFEWLEDLLWRARAGGWNVWSKPLKCPFGQPGDRLWVRETFCAFDEHRVHYRADYANDPKGDRKHGVVWTPSIHMPRWASRITLEITGVRVERLQDISEADAKAEGVLKQRLDDLEPPTHWRGFNGVWESTYGAEAWDANPWVWVIEFRRV